MVPLDEAKVDSKCFISATEKKNPGLEKEFMRL
jgi:hypothetical protein